MNHSSESWTEAWRDGNRLKLTPPLPPSFFSRKPSDLPALKPRQSRLEYALKLCMLMILTFFFDELPSLTAARMVPRSGRELASERFPSSPLLYRFWNSRSLSFGFLKSNTKSVA